jgi:hypothetical protein
MLKEWLLRPVITPTLAQVLASVLPTIAASELIEPSVDHQFDIGGLGRR